jgi:hypothetical protein
MPGFIVGALDEDQPRLAKGRRVVELALGG